MHGKLGHGAEIGRAAPCVVEGERVSSSADFNATQTQNINCVDMTMNISVVLLSK